MRYHMVVYWVPNPQDAHQVPIVDFEFDTTADKQTMTDAVEAFVEIAKTATELDMRRRRQKVSKESVNYRESEKAAECCGNCNMFVKPESCTLVSGAISPECVCDKWEHE